jgi:hypothetical protein
MKGFLIIQTTFAYRRESAGRFKLMKRTQVLDNNNGDDEEDTFNGPSKKARRRSGASSKVSQANDEMAEPSALQYLKNQRKQSKGIRSEMKRFASHDIRIDPEEYQSFYSDHLESSSFTLAEEDAQKLLWFGLSHQNVCIYGYGEKSRMIRNYAKHYLTGEDVLEVNCGDDGETPVHYYETSSTSWMKTIKVLVNTIMTEVLKDHRETSQLALSGPQLNLPYYCRLISGKRCE